LCLFGPSSRIKMDDLQFPRRRIEPGGRNTNARKIAVRLAYRADSDCSGKTFSGLKIS